MFDVMLLLLLCSYGAEGGGSWGSPLDIPATHTPTVTDPPVIVDTPPILDPWDPDPPPLSIEDAIDANPECIMERCGSCQCCYKMTQTRVTCSGNMTDVPTDLPQNTTHLTLRGTDIVNLTAVNIDGILVSKFSTYSNLERLEMTDNKELTQISAGAFNFDVISDSLKWLSIDGSPLLEEIQDGALGRFHVLSDLSIIYCGLTKPPHWTDHTFGPDIGTMYKIDLRHNKISEIPEGTFAAAQNIKLGIIDLSHNLISHVTKGTFNRYLEIGTIKLDHNQLTRIHDYAFNGSTIKTLTLSDNKLLKTLDQRAFINTNLQHLDLSRTSIERLPTDGLQTLTNLTIEETYTLQTFPSVLEMRQMKGARLTYPHHCCAFSHPEMQNKTAYEIFKRAMQSDCATYTPAVPTERSTQMSPSTTARLNDGFSDLGGVGVVPRGSKRKALTFLRIFSSSGARRRRSSEHDAKAFGEFQQGDSTNHTNSHYWQSNSNGGFHDEVPPDLGGFYDIVNDVDSADMFEDFDGHDPGLGFADGGFYAGTLNPASTYLTNVICGEVVEQIKKVHCLPEPDAFNPCEDVLGSTWLRIIAWVVVITAEVGNLAVITVSLCNKYRLSGLSVSKFLICNLAFADLTLGLYLLVLATYDLSSKGRYFTGAIVWQYLGGCQAAGFLATFATCLSTFTLTVITCERWYTISYAMNPDKRLRLRLASIIMVGGWSFSLIMAMLPLVGVSNFSKTSICLPMETKTAVDKGYIFTLMTVNASCFLIICVCYVDMYCKVRTSHNTSAVGRSDANIAKRMAFLVFTDFLCLFPIVFFAFTAAVGFPLIDVTKSKFLLVVFFPLNACANPFLYVIATKHFRRDFVSMLSRCGFCEKKASKYRLAMTSNPMSISHSRNSLSGVTQNLIHRPSFGSALTSTTCIDHSKGSKGSLSKSINGCPNNAPPSDTDRPSRFHSSETSSSERTTVKKRMSQAEKGGRDSANAVISDNQNTHGDPSSPVFGADDSRDSKPPGTRVRSVSEYSNKPLLTFAKSMDSFDYDKYKRKISETTNLTNVSETTFTKLLTGPILECPGERGSGRRHHRVTQNSIPGDSGFGEVDGDVLETAMPERNDLTPGLHSLCDVFHSSSSTDTSICPMSDKTSSSNGFTDETISTEKLSPVENSGNYCSSTANQDSHDVDDQDNRSSAIHTPISNRQKRNDFLGSLYDVQGINTSPRTGYTNNSFVPAESQ